MKLCFAQDGGLKKHRGAYFFIASKIVPDNYIHNDGLSLLERRAV